jgi:hypothetical protein
MRAHKLDAAEVGEVLVVLEDFLLHAGVFIVDELAAYPVVRPDDPQSWVLWIAGLLGEHAATLRALDPTTEEATTWPTHQPIGEPQ